jgi:hypothetical protein
MSINTEPVKPEGEQTAAAQLKGMTLRELIDLVGPDFLDAEINIQLLDGTANQRFAVEHTTVWARPRVFPGTAYPAQPLINLRVSPLQKIEE